MGSKVFDIAFCIARRVSRTLIPAMPEARPTNGLVRGSLLDDVLQRVVSYRVALAAFG